MSPTVACAIVVCSQHAYYHGGTMATDVPEKLNETPITPEMIVAFRQKMARYRHLGIVTTKNNGHLHLLFYAKRAKRKLKSTMLWKLCSRYIDQLFAGQGHCITVSKFDAMYLHLKVLL